MRIGKTDFETMRVRVQCEDCGQLRTLYVAPWEERVVCCRKCGDARKKANGVRRLGTLASTAELQGINLRMAEHKRNLKHGVVGEIP